MRRCPNPACPFRVRHGFAAEFADGVERCRSCEGELEEATEAGEAGGEPGLWLRAGVSLAVVAGLVVLAGEQGELSGGQPFAELALRPGLAAIIVAAIIVEALSLPLARTRAWRRSPDGRAKLWVGVGVLALALLAGPRHLIFDHELDLRFVVGLAGVPLLVGAALLVDRRGLGHGASLVVAAVLGQSLWVGVRGSPDPVVSALTAAGVALVAVVWLGRPARARSLGRSKLEDAKPGGERDFGLGLRLPITSVVPVAVLVWAPLIGGPFEALAELGLGYRLAFVVLLGLAIAAGCRPSRLLERWRRAFPRAASADLEIDARALFVRGLLRSELLLLGLLLIPGWTALPLMTLSLTAIALDLGRELGFRLQADEAVVAVDSFADLVTADALVTALELEGRSATVQGAQHRALWRGLGWWIPLRVLVGAEGRERVEALRAELLEASADDEPKK